MTAAKPKPLYEVVVYVDTSSTYADSSCIYTATVSSRGRAWTYESDVSALYAVRKAFRMMRRDMRHWDRLHRSTAA